MNSNQQTIDLINSIFAHKLHPNLNYFIGVRNNSLWFSEQNDFQISLSIFDCVFDLNRTNVVTNCGKLFVVCKNGVYFIKSNLKDFEFKPEIKLEYNDQQTQSQLFSINDKLFLSTSIKLYQITNNKLEFVQNRAGQYLQFCNFVYVLEKQGQTYQLMKLNSDLTTELIINTEMDQIALSNGVSIIFTKTRMLVFDMINNKLIEREINDKFKTENIHLQLELGSSGLQLKEECLIDLISPNFPQQIKNCYDDYIQDQMNRFPIYSQTFDKFIGCIQVFQESKM
ncbi:Conserved_hypothetical protein [Hexamita inflata]|uniref:Uncharacterized protein n=1 Tax=Hexamita inflata TaxID=28002 RepID=A0AA86Q056_9EUKA|nr:Conserved hypothetical protein [Hexamita inflata]